MKFPGVPAKQACFAGPDAAQPKHITTVWGYGYKWEG